MTYYELESDYEYDSFHRSIHNTFPVGHQNARYLYIYYLLILFSYLFGTQKGPCLRPPRALSDCNPSPQPSEISQSPQGVPSTWRGQVFPRRVQGHELAEEILDATGQSMESDVVKQLCNETWFHNECNDWQ